MNHFTNKELLPVPESRHFDFEIKNDQNTLSLPSIGGAMNLNNQATSIATPSSMMFQNLVPVPFGSIQKIEFNSWQPATGIMPINPFRPPQMVGFNAWNPTSMPFLGGTPNMLFCNQPASFFPLMNNVMNYNITSNSAASSSNQCSSEQMDIYQWCSKPFAKTSGNEEEKRTAKPKNRKRTHKSSTSSSEPIEDVPNNLIKIDDVAYDIVIKKIKQLKEEIMFNRDMAALYESAFVVLFPYYDAERRQTADVLFEDLDDIVLDIENAKLKKEHVDGNSLVKTFMKTALYNPFMRFAIWLVYTICKYRRMEFPAFNKAISMIRKRGVEEILNELASKDSKRRERMYTRSRPFDPVLDRSSAPSYKMFASRVKQANTGQPIVLREVGYIEGPRPDMSQLVSQHLAALQHVKMDDFREQHLGIPLQPPPRPQDSQKPNHN